VWLVFHPAGVASCSIFPRPSQMDRHSSPHYIDDEESDGEGRSISIEDADHSELIPSASMASCADRCRLQTVPPG
jgi:hypothetical protein